MKVSHLFYGNKMVDGDTNYDDYKNNPNLRVEYELDDSDFKELVLAMAVGTKATFSYNPTDDDIL